MAQPIRTVPPLGVNREAMSEFGVLEHAGGPAAETSDKRRSRTVTGASGNARPIPLLDGGLAASGNCREPHIFERCDHRYERSVSRHVPPVARDWCDRPWAGLRGRLIAGRRQQLGSSVLLRRCLDCSSTPRLAVTACARMGTAGCRPERRWMDGGVLSGAETETPGGRSSVASTAVGGSSVVIRW